MAVDSVQTGQIGQFLTILGGMNYQYDNVSLDSLDHALIAELRRDGRASLSDLSSILGAARATIRARIARLQERGIITGFSVVLAGEGAHAPIRSLTMLGIEGRGTDRIIRQLRGIPEVDAIHTTNGRWDLIIEIGTQTLETLDQVLGHIRRLEGVTTSETSVLLATRH